MGQVKNIKLHIVTDIKTRTKDQIKMADKMSNVVQGELMSWATTTDYTGPIGVTVKFTLKDSEVANFQALCKKQLDAVKSLPGMKVYKMHEDFKNPNCFFLVEEWESMAAWKPYLTSPERAENAKGMMPLMAGPPHIALYKIKN